MRTVLIMIGMALASLPGLAEAGRHHRRPAAQVATGTVVFVNNRPETVQLVLSGRVVGTVAPGDSVQLAVATGPLTLAAHTLTGAVVHTETVHLGAADVHEVRVAVRLGVLRVRNDSGVAITLYDGRKVVATLLPGQRERVSLLPGPHRLRAVYTQHGQERTLRSRRMTVHEGAEHALRLRPDAAALVAVDNALPVPAVLLVSGSPVGMMVPGERRLLELPVGLVDLAMLSRGRLLDAARVSVAPHLPSRWVARGAGLPRVPRRVEAVLGGLPGVPPGYGLAPMRPGAVRPQGVSVPPPRRRAHVRRGIRDEIEPARQESCRRHC